MLKKTLFVCLMGGFIAVLVFGNVTQAFAQTIASDISWEDDQSKGGPPNDGIPAQGKGNRGGRNSNNAGRGVEPIDEQEIEALQMALDDEYHALAVYQSVIATFGQVAPFVRIAQSEQQHINALINQFEKQDISVPENLWMDNLPVFDSLQAACQAGVEAELANVALYDQLFSMTDDPGLVRVFTNLSRASLESHLPQFEACQ
jgi:hypothetical protein